VKRKGHSIVVHSHSGENIEYAGVRTEVSRIVVNQVTGAGYWTELPPKREFEQKIRALLEEARERMA
jgi:predicted methyltransferase